MNCIFCCVFNQEKYIDMFFLLLESIFIYGNLDENTNILVYTSTPFMNIIRQSHLFNDEKIKFEINDTYDNIDKACKARLDLFNLPSIINYNKILYLDTDIIVKDNIHELFNVCKEDILYVLEEGNLLTSLDDYYGGKTLFGNEINNYNDKSAFTSGILLFNNCKKINDLFNKINEDIINRPYDIYCHDQPYIVYNAFKYNLYNNKILKSFIVNNDDNINSDKVIHHFPGGPGNYKHKIEAMTIFLNSLNKINRNSMKIYNIYTPPKKNTIFSLIGFCVSYKYFDTLQFTLPVNYLHFEKIYLITQEDDIETIEFCKKFNNVIVLFYTFKYDNKKFDKYGSLNYAQKIAYADYPESWYLIIDSDILLPNNMINILNDEKLNSECIYGAFRNNVDKSSELLDKRQTININKKLNLVYNNILYYENSPPSILGCFQLYKKHVYHRENLVDAAWGDYCFGYDNFKLFCNLDSLLYFHLGQPGKNWGGKIINFIDDINLSLDNLYYNFHKNVNLIYYNEKCKIVKYGNSEFIDTLTNKTYTWGNSYIKFLDHFKMDAFGEGYYSFINSKNIIANFGGREHNIIFNDDYTLFKSTRKDDLSIVHGKLINLTNKTYTWEASYIKFLDHFKMDAFGEGYYSFINKQNIIAKFGGREHNIIFNDDYTSFTSTRKDDLQIVNGKLHNI
jgi:hypothetical protein